MALRRQPTLRIILLLAMTYFAQVSSLNAAPGTADVLISGFKSGFWCRYVVIDKNPARSGWIAPEIGNEAYRIAGVIPSENAHVRGIAYAPGCALQTFDIALPDPRTYSYSFICKAVPQLQISGSVTPLGRRYDHPVRIEAKYVADWAPEFLKYEDGTTTEIPLGDTATIDENNQFHSLVPDLVSDKLAGLPDHRGEIRIWVRDVVTDRIVDQLRASATDTKSPATRLGGIPIESLHSGDNALRFSPANDRCAHDEYGFSYRVDANNTCPQ